MSEPEKRSYVDTEKEQNEEVILEGAEARAEQEAVTLIIVAPSYNKTCQDGGICSPITDRNRISNTCCYC
jgi:hypothetical protein